MKTATPKRRSAGRPKDGSNEDRRARLIAAAGPIFSQRGYAATTIPELARAADVTPAMVHYYFGGKEGLLLAAFEEAFLPLLEKIDKPSTLEEWVIVFHNHILGHRWMPHLMLREVIMEGGHLRDFFITRFGPHFAMKWFSLLAAEKTSGRLREDANEFRHVIMLMGMLIYPFVVSPISGALTGQPFSDDDMVRFREDAVRLFFKGATG